MNKKFSLLFLAAHLFSCSIMAEQVDVQTAQIVALNFIKANMSNPGGQPLTATLKYIKTEADNTVDFYVFDIAPVNGFVMVAADDHILPVLAYSTETNFKITGNHSGVNNWISQTAGQIHAAILQQIPLDSRTSDLWQLYIQGNKTIAERNSTVPPLVATLWDQEPFYNTLCPYNSADHQRCLTGCVATAMAGIMKFWNYPPKGTGSHSYNDIPPNFSYNYGVQSANFDSTTYQWQQMPNTLHSNSPAIATLMYQCGVSIEMDYGDDNQNGSGAYGLQDEAGPGKPCAQLAFKTYFGYNPSTIRGIWQTHFTAANWLNTLKGELNAGRPILYEGTDVNDGGHAWICDGFDANDMLHMNWGWSGDDNGYFTPSALTGQGDDFNTEEGALIGIEPLFIVPVTASASNNSSICPGDTVVLTAQATGPVSYRWIPAPGVGCDTCASITVNPVATTTYTVLIDSSGYLGRATVTVNVDSIHLSTTYTNAATGQSNGSATVNPAGGISPYSFEWNTNDTSQTISNLAAGSYTVTVSDNNSCKNSAIAIVGTSTGISAPGQNILFSIYPNPAKTEVVIALPEPKLTTVSFKNVLGQTLLTQTMSASSTPINLSDFAEGIYWVELKQGENKAVKEIIISGK